MVVIEESDAFFRQCLARPVENCGGLLDLGCGKRAFVGNSGGADKLHPKRLSLLDDLVEVLGEHPIILNGGDRLEAEPVQRRAELTRGHAAGARELNFAESEVAGELQTEADILGEDVPQTV